MSDTANTCPLPAPAAAELAHRAEHYRHPERDPEGDCTPELAEAMALQDMCGRELRRLEDATDTADTGKLRALYAALAAL